MAHTLTADELAELDPRPKAPKMCRSRRHRVRTPAGRPTANLMLRGVRSDDGGKWLYLESVGCRACKNEARKLRRQPL
jgi:hypothetical protein